jgi:polar amino acid transport system substrate-binding protein
MTKAILSLALAFSTLASLSGHAAPWKQIQRNGTLQLATEGAFAPFNFFKGKELTGFEVELGTELAKKLALKPDWKTTPFDSLLIGLNQNRYDLVAASHGITDERAKAVDFSKPHYCTGGIIVSRKGGPKTAADLKGKTVAVQVGTSYLTNVQKLPGLKDVKTFPKDPDSLQNLMGGRVDAWVTDKFVAIDALNANPKAGLELGELVFQEQVGMAVAKGNKDLLSKINEGLDGLVKDGTYARLSQKYFQQDVSCK